MEILDQEVAWSWIVSVVVPSEPPILTILPEFSSTFPTLVQSPPKESMHFCGAEYSKLREVRQKVCTFHLAPPQIWVLGSTKVYTFYWGRLIVCIVCHASMDSPCVMISNSLHFTKVPEADVMYIKEIRFLCVAFSQALIGWWLAGLMLTEMER